MCRFTPLPRPSPGHLQIKGVFGISSPTIIPATLLKFLAPGSVLLLLRSPLICSVLPLAPHNKQNRAFYVFTPPC